MENIIVAILFTYPGAFVEFTYWKLAKDAAFYKKPEEYFRIARVFFLSAIVTLFCLLLFGIIEHGQLELSNAVYYLEQRNNAIIYSIVSVVISCMVGFVWYGLSCLRQLIRNKWRLNHRKAPDGKCKQVWMSMLADPDVPKMDYVLEIWKHGKLMKRGYIMHLPDDLREDTGFVLMHCDLVEEVLNTPDQDLISDPLVSYVDIATETEIIIRDAKKYLAWVTREDEQERKEN